MAAALTSLRQKRGLRQRAPFCTILVITRETPMTATFIPRRSNADGSLPRIAYRGASMATSTTADGGDTLPKALGENHATATGIDCSNRACGGFGATDGADRGVPHGCLC